MSEPFPELLRDVHSVNETVCLHCWHSDPGKEKDSRWYCCHCPQECFESAMDVRRCVGCHMRSLPNPWGFCVMCAEVIDNWLVHQKPDADDHYLNECLREYRDTLNLEPNRQTSTRRHMGYRNRHKIRAVIYA